MPTSNDSRHERGAGIVLILAVVAAAMAALFVTAGTVAAVKHRRVVKNWERTLGSKEEILARYPPTEANPAALELEGLTVSLGIDLAPRLAEGRERPSDEQKKAHGAIKRVLNEYLRDELQRTRRGIAAPPASVASFLEVHADALRAVRHHLVRNEIPQWERHVERLQAAPLPNLLGHIELHRLLLTDALVRTREGDREGALADLEASWRLNLSLRDQPPLISQLIVIGAARMQAGALRQMQDVPAAWLDRLDGRDHRHAFFTALAFEGWIWSQIRTPSAYADEQPAWERLTASVTGPYYRYCLDDISDTFRERVANLSRVDALCGADLAAQNADLRIQVPRWNVPGSLVVPNLANALDRLIRLEMDLELNRKLIELESRGSAPAGNVPSDACPGDRWTYDTAPDRSVTIAFDREMSWPGAMGPILPTRFTL